MTKIPLGSPETKHLILALLGVMGCCVVIVAIAGQHERAYERDAIDTSGTITSKWISRGAVGRRRVRLPQRHMTVSFTDYAGNQRSVPYDPPSAEWTRRSPGDTVAVWYVPSDPTIYSIKSHEYVSWRQTCIAIGCAAGFLVMLVTSQFFRMQRAYDQSIIDAALHCEPRRRDFEEDSAGALSAVDKVRFRTKLWTGRSPGA